MWYYIKNEQMLGPISLEELVNLINAGRITKTTYVWESGKMRQLASEAEELAEFFQDDEPEQSEAQSKPLPQFTETKKVVSHKKDAGVLDSVVASTGLDNLKGFSLYDLFSETFKRHTDDEMERYFGVGTPLTTPPISQVDASWPKPWLFLRLILLGIGGYLLLWSMSSNLKAIPGMIIFGSFVIPLATLTFFFECNVVKNISLYQVIKLFLYGGAVGFIFTTVLNSFFPSLSDPDNLSASSAGLIEEPAKLLVLILVLIMGGLKRKDYILNGLLCGAAVGAGFAAFESAGYAFERLFYVLLYTCADYYKETLTLISTSQINIFNEEVLKDLFEGFLEKFNNNDLMIHKMTSNIHLRAVLAPFGHVIWTAMCAGALWRVKKGKDFAISMLFNPMFLIVFAIAVTLHMTWNSDTFINYFGIYGWCALGIIGWTVIFGMIGLGLRQVRQQQKYIATKEAQRKQAKPQ
ncbi:MAG: PrsW family intramembrane metalloprotease [Thermoguttaceae bacterium]|nr:PrsW family intramembrane metalloprotease [Thermoguttaceae bacterium]